MSRTNLTETFKHTASDRLTAEVKALQADLGLGLEAAIAQAGQSSVAGPAVWAEVRERLAPWILRRDGLLVARFATEQAAWAYLHGTHGFSVSHALRYEGYALGLEEVAP